MDKNERLLDLIALFLDASSPLTWAEIREAFPEDYGQVGERSAMRKFQRDRKDLAELGIVITYHPVSEDGPEGYELQRDAYYLPAVPFSPEELAVLYAAGSAALASGAFPGRVDLGNALRKIALASPKALQPAPNPLHADLGTSKEGVAERLEALWQALLARKRVTLRYRGLGRDEETVREVDPWGVCLRRGTWVLVGYCHLRRARRTFHVDRIASLEVNALRPNQPDYEVPADFRIEDVAAEQAWEHRVHEPIDVLVDLGPALAPLASRLFPNAQVEPRGDRARVRVRARYLDALLRRVLALGEGARVLEPERARARAAEMLQAIAAAHTRAGRKEAT